MKPLLVAVCLSLVVATSIGGCATVIPAPTVPTPVAVAVAKPAPAPSRAGLIISGKGTHEVLVNGKSYGKQDGTAWSFQVDHLVPGDYVVKFVDAASGRVGVTTSYTAELLGEGYLRVHHAPR